MFILNSTKYILVFGVKFYSFISDNAAHVDCTLVLKKTYLSTLHTWQGCEHVLGDASSCFSERTSCHRQGSEMIFLDAIVCADAVQQSSSILSHIENRCRALRYRDPLIYGLSGKLLTSEQLGSEDTDSLMLGKSHWNNLSLNVWGEKQILISLLAMSHCCKKTMNDWKLHCLK